ncbi:hypothetical protein, partial [Nonomuraea diastatica]
SAVGSATMARMVGGAVGVAVVSVVIDHPFMTGPFAGLAGALALCVAISVLIGALALTKITKMRPDPGDVMVKVPRKLLLELRMTLATVAAEADALLPVETRTPPTTTPPALQPDAQPVSPVDTRMGRVPLPRAAETGPLAGTRGPTN